jgi:aldehyde:ferredoxin oxidoreductase
MGSALFWDLVRDKTIDGFHESNVVTILTSPLTGTLAPGGASRVEMQCIGVQSYPIGWFTRSNLGGRFGPMLKYAGWDGIVIEGKAEKPVYAYVENGQVTLHDASDLWGKGVHETIKILQERHGDEKTLSVIAIGPAGENLVKFANWMNENDRSSGRGGTGCVGGSKRLKAIVIRGKRADRPRPVDRDGWKTAHQRALATIMDEANVTSPRKGGLSVYGTNVLMNITNNMGALPTRNGQATSFGEHGELISGEHVKATILVNDPTCHACPVACKKEVEVKEGPFKVHMESVEYEPAWSLGAMCGNDDVGAVAYIIDRANDYGYDAIEIGVVLALYMEYSQRGYANGDGLAWGDTHGMVELARKIAFREGVGDILAEGTGQAAAKLGHPELGMHVKGQAIPAYDPRGLKGMGLGYATSNRGGCHLRGYSPASELGLIPLKTDPLAWKGKGELLKLLQDLHAFSDSLDLCKFSAFAEGAEEYALQYSAMTGRTITADDVLKAGERVYNLERYYNNLCGFDGKDDTLPERFLKEPSTMPGSQGHVCELDLMKEEYYRVRGWDNGVVTEAKLKELEII